jgi:hypothetical protein
MSAVHNTETTINQQLQLIRANLDKQKIHATLFSRLDRLEKATFPRGTYRDTMASTLRIMTWNSNGLLQHKESLLDTLIDQKLDAGLISETRVTRESYLKLHGYEVYHSIYPSNCVRGEVLLLSKQDI